MLVELRIRDYAVVRDLTLNLGPGLNALTGETGAGKSIIVGALSLLLGERASADVVRTGAERASVEAVFDVSGMAPLLERLDELGYPPEDGLLILRREVAAAGRNRAWVNGSPATAGVVGELGSALVDLHGQHEHQTLLRPAEQRGLLDAFAGSGERVSQVRALHGRVQALREEVEAREDRLRAIATRADFLRFQLQEIEDATLSPGEDEALQAELRRLEHAQELAQGAEAAHRGLYEDDASVADRIAEFGTLLGRLVRFDPTLEDAVASLEEARHAVTEVGRRLGDYASSVEHDPGRLEEVRARIDLLFRLKQKYGPELGDVLATAQRVRAELQELEDADHCLGDLKAGLEKARAELLDAAAALTGARAAAAHRLEEAMEETLPGLGLDGAVFRVRLDPADEVGPGGAERVEFLVSLNPGFEPMPLRRIASGGEMARVMLALKAILADVDRIPVLVFDEIDAGIGGVVATAVARKLTEVAAGHQVFVVTHLAQLASRARGHFVVAKAAQEGVTTATVRRLEGDARIEEIARMLGGDPGSETSRDHAREMLGVG